jgi:hypothetical protein
MKRTATFNRQIKCKELGVGSKCQLLLMKYKFPKLAKPDEASRERSETVEAKSGGEGEI